MAAPGPTRRSGLGGGKASPTIATAAADSSASSPASTVGSGSTSAPLTDAVIIKMEALIAREKTGKPLDHKTVTAVRTFFTNHTRAIVHNRMTAGLPNFLVGLPPRLNPALKADGFEVMVSPQKWAAQLAQYESEAKQVIGRKARKATSAASPNASEADATPVAVAAAAAGPEEPEPSIPPPVNEAEQSVPAPSLTPRPSVAPTPPESSTPAVVPPSRPPTVDPRAHAVQVYRNYAARLQSLPEGYLLDVAKIREVLAMNAQDKAEYLSDLERKKRFDFSMSYYRARNLAATSNTASAGQRPVQPQGTSSSAQTLGNPNFRLSQPPPPRGFFSSVNPANPALGMAGGGPGMSMRALEPEDTKRKRKFREWMKEVAPGMEMELGLPDTLDDYLTTFILDVASSATRLAKHRKAAKVEIKDVAFYLDQQYDMTVPGFDTLVPKRVPAPVPEDKGKPRAVLPRIPRPVRAGDAETTASAAA